jgi:hypothetical protein
MKQGTTDNIPKTDDKKIESIFWSIVLGSLFLFGVVICVGLYLRAEDYTELASYLICLGIAAMGSLVVYGPLRHYLKIPVWRWSVSRATAAKMNKTHKLCVWLGTSCSLAGTLFIMNHVAWRWIFRIRGDRLLGSMPFRVFWVGPAMLFIGLCFIQISMHRCVLGKGYMINQ